jgi:arylsulfatase
LLAVAGLPQPLLVNGVTQQPIEGVSMVYSFDEPDAPDRHETQYFEILGNRGIYHKGWTAVAAHNPPGAGWPHRSLTDAVWELYDTRTDWSQARNLAHQHPDKLRELQRLFLIEAARHNVLPLEDRVADLANPDTAGRPVLARACRQRLYRGVGRLNAFSVINIKNKSHRVAAEIHVPPGGSEGVIVAQGGFPGGWSLYVKDSRPKYCYNFYGVDLFHIESTERVPPGTHNVRMEFQYDGSGPAKGGTVTLFIDDQPVGEGRVERTQPLPFASDEPLEIATDTGSPVTRDYSVRRFTGDVHWVDIEIPEDAPDFDDQIPAEQRLEAALVKE